MSLDFHNIFVYNRYTGSLYWKYQRISKRNTSKVIGIHWAKDKQKWVAKKTIKGKLVFYKYYDDFELAKKDLAFFSEFLMDPQVKQLCITRYE